MLVEDCLEGVLLQDTAALDTGGVAVRESVLGLERLFVLAHDKLEFPLPAEPVAVFDHAGDLVAGIYVQQREGHMAEEGLARQPQHHGRVFANAPQHGQAVELVERLAQDVDALAFEFIQQHKLEGCIVA